jgi:hypothetical protein
VQRLRTSTGELRILLQPEMLNNLASSFVLEARRNPKGLGALEERRLPTGAYAFPESRDLREDERETDPLRVEPDLGLSGAHPSEKAA